MISAPPPRKVSAEMPRIAYFLLRLSAALALACFLAAVWLEDHTWKLVWTGIVLLFASVVISASIDMAKKK